MTKKLIIVIFICVFFAIVSYLYFSEKTHSPVHNFFLKQYGYWLDLRTGQGKCGLNESKYDFAILNHNIH